MVDPGIWVPQYGIIAFMCTITLHNMGVSAWSGFLRGLLGWLTNNIIYRSVSTTTSEGCPYDIHRRVVHIISIVEGLSN